MNLLGNDVMRSNVAWFSWGKTQLVSFERRKNSSTFWCFFSVRNQSTIFHYLTWYSCHRFPTFSKIWYSPTDFWGKQGVKSVKRTPQNIFFVSNFQPWAILCEQLTGILILNFWHLRFIFLTFSMPYLYLRSYEFSI